jgi:hypothetical protein
MFTKEAQNFTSAKALFSALAADLLANGFTQKFPVQPLTSNDLTCTLEVGATVDPLAATQKWRIHLETFSTEDRLGITVATPTQLPDDGTVAVYDDGFSVPGYIGSALTSLVGANIPFFDRRCYETAQQKLSYPVSYKLTITSHGIALYMWEPGSDIEGNNWSCFVIQRSVSNVDGAARITGKCPLHCMFAIKRWNRVFTGANSYAPQDLYKRFVVRESDVERPTIPIVANADTDDGSRSINTSNMSAITEDNSYIIMFPNNLNTQRYVYPVDELDMLAYTSADVISQNTDASITMYGEAQPRLYRAMCASDVQSTGMRFLMLHAAPSLI